MEPLGAMEPGAAMGPWGLEEMPSHLIGSGSIGPRTMGPWGQGWGMKPFGGHGARSHGGPWGSRAVEGGSTGAL